MNTVLLVPVMLFLLATLPASAHKPVLFANGSRPPDMTGRDTDGKTWHLHTLHGRKRVVLLSVQNAEYQDNVRQHRAQFAERDLLVLTTDLPSYQFYLVGKDGHVKMARHTPPTNAELFATIDAMPMRQAEMHERK